MTQTKINLPPEIWLKNIVDGVMITLTEMDAKRMFSGDVDYAITAEALAMNYTEQLNLTYDAARIFAQSKLNKAETIMALVKTNIIDDPKVIRPDDTMMDICLNITKNTLALRAWDEQSKMVGG